MSKSGFERCAAYLTEQVTTNRAESADLLLGFAGTGGNLAIIADLRDHRDTRAPTIAPFSRTTR